jgi:hypothetical protein
VIVVASAVGVGFVTVVSAGMFRPLGELLSLEAALAIVGKRLHLVPELTFIVFLGFTENLEIGE